jgi:hypothetical protein
VFSRACPDQASLWIVATTVSAMSSRLIQLTFPFPAGARITPSSPVKKGTKSA